MYKALPAHVDLDDMVQAGILGLISAASKYDLDKHIVFSSYAKHRIRGAIIDSLRQLDWASRDMRRLQKQVMAATTALAVTLHRAPTEAEIAERLGVSVARLRHLMSELHHIGLLSPAKRGGEKEDLPTPEFSDSPDRRPDRICARAELRSTLANAIRLLPERHQMVVTLYYYNEMTMKEIGTVLGINESRVSQIHKTSLDRMAAGLDSIGITLGKCILSDSPCALG
jgi:RNA polymerase sigma factor for flagellar operon FliA